MSDNNKYLLEVRDLKQHFNIPNGLFGSKKLKEMRAEFKVTYRPGTLEAANYRADGSMIGRSVLQTADEDTVLRITREPDSVAGGEDDLIFVEIARTDAAGIVKTQGDAMLHVSLSPEGELLAIGSANPRPLEPYDGCMCRLYQGRAQVVMRKCDSMAAAENAAPMMLRVESSDGLSAELKLG